MQVIDLIQYNSNHAGEDRRMPVVATRLRSLLKRRLREFNAGLSHIHQIKPAVLADRPVATPVLAGMRDRLLARGVLLKRAAAPVRVLVVANERNPHML
jgi:hypothetical protein